MIKSSFHGVIDEIPGISVDNFERADAVQARAYFLSHCHSDHTQGLFTKELIETLERTRACLYMSEPTAAIIEDENNDERLLKYIKILPLGRNSIILPPSPSQNLPELYLTVTLITAAHSFGSVMFLFQTTNKNVLFTGDFRISNNNVSKYTYFHDKNGDAIHLDALYVDTTFLDEYTPSPERPPDAIDKLHEVISQLATAKHNPIYRAQEEYQIKPEIVHFRSANPALKFEINSDSIVRVIQDLLTSNAVKQYTDIAAKKAAVVYRTIKEEMRKEDLE
ncbi:protein artemis-like [Hyposmocoma kahamanoa]|uniref:protein artemis-like n=1 Tax=Hyposmocoma kahamanoa TaxID=1477025 RepID=UPI000E6D85AC|nr:protein artemis-like [Hyposmocoma kahamanoa]